jgi:hypothetical protein
MRCFTAAQRRETANAASDPTGTRATAQKPPATIDVAPRTPQRIHRHAAFTVVGEVCTERVGKPLPNAAPVSCERMRSIIGCKDAHPRLPR